jgi:hypothetical protein
MLKPDKHASKESAMQRPEGYSKRDLLVGLLAVTACKLGLPAPLDLAAKVTEPLFGDYVPGERWFPLIDPAHARLAIHHATKLARDGYFTKEECDWICDKARKAIIHGLPNRQMTFAPEAPNAA